MLQSDACTQGTLWVDGWYRYARALPSANFNQRPAHAQVDLIVIHSICLPPHRYGGQAVQQLFTNTLQWSEDPYFESIRDLRVSAHFYIQRDGALWQFVNVFERAWHAGVSCYRGRTDCNDDSVGIELEGRPGDLFDDRQYETLACVCAALTDTHPIACVAGHEHIAAQRKTDPGPGFDWPRLQRSLAWPDSYLPKTV